MNSSIIKSGIKACSMCITAGTILLSSMSASGEVVFDFEAPNPLGSGVVGGDKAYFSVTSEQARNGSNSLKFEDAEAKPYENFTYELPFDDFTSGVVSLWFYDSKTFNTQHDPKAGGSVIVEDKDNPQDFVALEILSLMYPMPGFNPAYYATEGTVDRAGASRFDSALPRRAIGWHQVEFHISPTETTVFVDGIKATKVAGPGSAANLRLRFMADSPSNGGGEKNWITQPRAESWWIGQEWIYFDDITITRELPSLSIHSQDFEIFTGVATYDTPTIPESPGGPGVEGYDNEYMAGFVNQWAINTSSTAVHSGSQSFYFANAAPEPLKSITFDLTGVQAGTTATLYFYDALGQDSAFDKNNSILIEDANDPARFMGLEINNWPYPYSAPTGQKTYFVVNGNPGSSPGDPATGAFYSKGLFPRAIGWHTVEIGFYADYTNLYVDGHEARFINSYDDDFGPARGPGLDKSLRLRLMADGATQGGFTNWTNVDELTALYQISNDPYVYYDDITLPIPPPAAVSEWQLY